MSPVEDGTVVEDVEEEDLTEEVVLTLDCVVGVKVVVTLDSLVIEVKVVATLDSVVIEVKLVATLDSVVVELKVVAALDSVVVGFGAAETELVDTSRIEVVGATSEVLEEELGTATFVTNVVGPGMVTYLVSSTVLAVTVTYTVA